MTASAMDQPGATLCVNNLFVASQGTYGMDIINLVFQIRKWRLREVLCLCLKSAMSLPSPSFFTKVASCVLGSNYSFTLMGDLEFAKHHYFY